LRIDLASLQFGQRKDVIVFAHVPATAMEGESLQATLRCNTRGADKQMLHEGLTSIAKCSQPPTFDLEPQRCRLNAIDGIRQAMSMMKLSSMDKMQGVPLPLPKVQAHVKSLAEQLSASTAAASEEMQALIEDITGQVAEACSREEWYEKWGVHYLPSLLWAHSAQQCNNFKDPGVQHYGGDLFYDFRDQADDIFCQLPPPVPSVRRPKPSATLAAAAAPAPGAPTRTAVTQAAAPVSMASYYDRFSG
jgi:hypothetical protein